MAEANGPRAHDILLGYEPLAYHGACWHYVWQAYAQAGASTAHGALPTAYDAWQASSGKHYDMNPPEGAAIWLGKRYDGEMSGDVFIAGTSDGHHAATDQPVYGQTGETTIKARMNLCGREYLGWTDHVLDCPITLGGNQEEDMPTTIYKPFTVTGDQVISSDAYLHINDDKDTSVAVGSCYITGDLYVQFEPVAGTPTSEGASVQFYAVVEKYHPADGSSSLGIQEFLYTSGGTSGHVPIGGIHLNSDQRLRFRAKTSDGSQVRIKSAVFRGLQFK